tara:strand:+ start:18 stop:719 length:702 start_codon:yes stop_codon:yes gene_type:complete
MKLLTFSGLDTTSYYSILELSRDASKKEIKKAYKRLSRKYHPDVYEGPAEYFQKVKEAYETLMDDKRRLRYDSTNLSEMDFKKAVLDIAKLFAGFYFEGIKNENQMREAMYAALNTELAKAKAKYNEVESTLSKIGIVLDEIEDGNFLMDSIKEVFESDRNQTKGDLATTKAAVEFVEAKIGLVVFFNIKTKNRTVNPNDWNSRFQEASMIDINQNSRSTGGSTGGTTVYFSY